MVRYRFDDFDLDVGVFQLWRGDEALPLQPKVFEVLRYLVEHRGRMVTKAELLDQLWQNEDVNEAVISWSVSHIRRALNQDRAAKRPIETVHGRGYRFNAEVHEVVVPVRASAPPPRLRGPSFVGRERVIDELERHLSEAVAGHGSLCVLTGEAGIGKTRCVEELLARAPALELRVLAGRCPHATGTPFLWPIDSALAHVDGPIALRGRALIASLRAGDEDGAGAASERFRVIEQLALCLHELARQQPLLLVVDDLQWADAGTLRLVSFVAPELRDTALCIVVTVRDGEREPGSSRDRTLQHTLRNASTIALGALEPAQVADLMQAVTDFRPSEALADAIHRASGGVPLFAHEVIRSLVREHTEAGLDRVRPDAVRTSELARDVLRARLGELPAATGALLAQAAVIGDSFDLPLLATLADLESDALLELLEPAVADGQLEAEAPHTYRFAHALHQSALYDDLASEQRVATHRKLGALLRAGVGSAAFRGEAQRGEIARHYYLSLAAGEPAEVLDLARHAAEAAVRGQAFDEAVLYYGWALEAQALAGYEPRARALLLQALASSQRSAGRTGDAMATAAQVIELAQQHGLHDLVVRATLSRRPTIAMATVPDAVTRAALEVVLREVVDTTHPVRISALAQLACVPPYDPQLVESKELSARAVALAEQLDERELLFEALRARLFSLSGPDDIDEVLRVSDRILMLDRLGPHSWQSMDARLSRISAYILAGRMTLADAAIEEAAKVVGGPQWGEAMFYCQRMRTQRLFMDGHVDQAEQRWAEVFKQAVRAGVGYADVLNDAFMLNLQVEREGPAAAFERHAPGLRSLRAIPRPLRPGFARLAAEAGKLDMVREYLGSLGDLGNYPRNGSYVHGLACIATCAVALGDRARCAQLIELLAPYAALNTPDAMSYYLGSVSYFLGRLSEALGMRAEATQYFAQAVEHNRAMGYSVGVARARARSFV